MRVTIDGGTPMDLLLYNSSLTMDKDAAGYISHPGATGSSTSALNLAWKMVLELPYNTSCLVAVIIGTAAGAGDLEFETVRKVPV